MATPISARTGLLGVLGDPVGHSLSPAMHNAALAELGLDWIYLGLPVQAGQLAAAVRGLEAIGCRGLNVTIPHKQAVAALCTRLTPLAERVGAVNTLVPLEGGGWLGTNTDVEGFLAPLRQQPWAGRRAVVLGNGGSARAVAAALVELDLGSITVVGRRAESLDAFAASCSDWAPQLATRLTPGLSGESSDPALLELLAAADLVVNTTPVGMNDAVGINSGLSPLAEQACAALQPAATVYDLIYVPRPTRLLRLATARGCRSIDGLTMLVHQGAAALQLWSGQNTVPVATMTAAAEAALAR